MLKYVYNLFNTFLSININIKYMSCIIFIGKLATHTENEEIKKNQRCSSSTNHMDTSFKVCL